MKVDEKVGYYLQKGLKTAGGSHDSRPSEPLINAFLFVLDDFLADRLTAEQLSSISQALYRFDYLSQNLISESPDDFAALDLAMALAKAKPSQKKQIMIQLRHYYQSKQAQLRRLRAMDN